MSDYRVMYQQSKTFQTIRQHNEQRMLMQRKDNEYLETSNIVSECYRLKNEYYNNKKIIDDEWDFDEK